MHWGDVDFEINKNLCYCAFLFHQQHHFNQLTSTVAMRSFSTFVVAVLQASFCAGYIVLPRINKQRNSLQRIAMSISSSLKENIRGAKTSPTYLGVVRRINTMTALWAREPARALMPDGEWSPCMIKVIEALILAEILDRPLLLLRIH